MVRWSNGIIDRWNNGKIMDTQTKRWRETHQTPMYCQLNFRPTYFVGILAAVQILGLSPQAKYHTRTFSKVTLTGYPF